jgi:hypothetical protein
VLKPKPAPARATALNLMRLMGRGRLALSDERVEQLQQIAPTVESALRDELAGTSRSLLFLGVERAFQHAKIESVLRSRNRVVREVDETLGHAARTAARMGLPLPLLDAVYRVAAAIDRTSRST